MADTVRPLSQSQMDTATWAMVVGLSILWGGSFFFVELAVKELPPFTIVLTRLVLAVFALLIGLHVLRLKLPRDWKVWKVFLTLGLMNNAIPFSLFVWAQTHIPSGLASILNATTPLFTVVLAHFFITGERLKALKFIGILTGLAGVSVMIGVDALDNLGADVLAQLACLAAAFFYGVSGVVGKRVQALRQPPLVIATGQLISASIWIAPLVFIVEAPWTLPMPGMTTVSALLGLSIISTSVAYFIYFNVLSRTSATNLLLVTFLVPISAVLLGTLVLGETLSSSQWLGMAIIGLSLLMIDGRVFNRP